MIHWKIYFVPLLAMLVLSGCDGRNPDWKATYSVHGEVYVDGKPAEGVALNFHPTSGFDTESPSITSAMTDAEGRFAASTYEVGDGAPAGEYVITLKWPALNKMSMSFDGDKLKGAYDDPKSSKFTLSVTDGPVIVDRIDLKTK